MNQLLKDIFFTYESINSLADAVQQAYPKFDRGRFLDLIYDEAWEGRALMEKMSHAAVCLHESLPDSYGQSLEILKQVAPSVMGFEALTFPEFVAVYGQDERDLSLPALGYFTKYGSAEFAIRPFLVSDPDRTMEYMVRWSKNDDPMVRRLASEGCRPRLPWGIALHTFRQDPGPILPILENLKDDDAETVRRSVSNNLNDISKDHPDLVLDICERWYGTSEHTNWIVKHACRSMLKAGNTRAMLLFGFGDPVDIHVNSLEFDKKEVRIGEEVYFSFTLVVDTTGESKVRLEYAVDFIKARGQTSRKVFQIKELSYDPGSYPIKKKHSFVDRSTRKHYPGDHQFTIIINGTEKARAMLRVH